jgi:hypothetical protein
MDRRMAQGAFGRQLTVPDHVRFDGTIAEERTSPDVRLELTPDIEHKKGRRPTRKDCPASQPYFREYFGNHCPAPRLPKNILVPTFIEFYALFEFWLVGHRVQRQNQKLRRSGRTPRPEGSSFGILLKFLLRVKLILETGFSHAFSDQSSKKTLIQRLFSNASKAKIKPASLAVGRATAP